MSTVDNVRQCVVCGEVEVWYSQDLRTSESWGTCYNCGASYENGQLISNPETKQVVVEVRGGIVQRVSFPQGVEVHVFDFDEQNGEKPVIHSHYTKHYTKEEVEEDIQANLEDIKAIKDKYKGEIINHE